MVGHNFLCRGGGLGCGTSPQPDMRKKFRGPDAAPVADRDSVSRLGTLQIRTWKSKKNDGARARLGIPGRTGSTIQGVASRSRSQSACVPACSSKRKLPPPRVCRVKLATTNAGKTHNKAFFVQTDPSHPPTPVLDPRGDGGGVSSSLLPGLRSGLPEGFDTWRSSPIAKRWDRVRGMAESNEILRNSNLASPSGGNGGEAGGALREST